MALGILGRKVGMTRIFDQKGNTVPVSVIEAGPCKVTQVKTQDKDAYNAIQVGYEAMRGDRARKPQSGHLKKAGVDAVRFLREFRLEDGVKPEQYQLGQEIRVDIFKEGDHVDVLGLSKGRGFQGVVKRHGFTGMRATHGANEYFRRPGSLGTNTFGSNVKRGKKMPGHYGNERITLLNLEVVKVDPQENLLVLKGGIPGARGGLVVIRKSNRG